MVHAKSKKTVGLGNALMKDRFGSNRGADRKRASAVTRTNHATGEQYITNDREEASWVKMRSVTEQGALDEFLATAELAGTDFTAEKINNVRIIHTDQQNPFLLSAAQERVVRGKHRDLKARLTVPRRPNWSASTTPVELDRLEKDAFLDWRRGLAELEEGLDLLVTPFERNIEVWRQLWRVIERSDIVVQIVDARNPLLFRCEDLEIYVKTVDPRKENLLLINKADMMTLDQRKAWAKYLKNAGIAYRFFSAQLAKEMNEAQEFMEPEEPEESVESDKANNTEETAAPTSTSDADIDERDGGLDSGIEVELEDEDSRILTVDELEDIFLEHAPERADPARKLEVGLVGYPNVGKSSTINALIGSKKVSVSSTPGKTKHFQTIHLSDKVVLCDCPGLVFPNFATTKAELVCNGILPIDQMREYTGPCALVTQRIPQTFLEAVYGIRIKTRPLEEGGTGIPTAHEFLQAYAKARGFTTTGHGTADESRAARLILKDYVNGKLLYCEPPPGDIDPAEFNRELYGIDNVPEKRRAALASAMESLSIVDADTESVSTDMASLAPRQGAKSQNIDKKFFGPGGGNAAHMKMPFNYKYTEQGRDKPLTGRKARTIAALENDLDPKDVRMGGKKHFKGGPRGKGKKKATDVDDEA